MTTLATALKEEIRRLARKEIRAETSMTKRSSAQYRRDIAAWKRQVRDLTKEVTYLKRQEQKRPSKSSASDVNGVRFSPSWVEAHRERLELSAADYGALVGVTAQTIYNWEKRTSRPGREQLAAWGAIKGLGKREAWKRLESMEE